MTKRKLKQKHGYIRTGGGVLIFNKEKKVLLMKRGIESENEAGWWSKPGGAIEIGETAIKAMKREIKEELDIEINIWGYLPHTDHIIKKENQCWIAINYLADIKFGNPRIMEPRKCEEINWFSLKKLPRKLTQSTREPIKYYLNKKYIKLH